MSMPDFAQVTGLIIQSVDFATGTAIAAFTATYQHSGNVTNVQLTASFTVSGGIAAMNTAIVAAVRAEFAADNPQATGTLPVVIPASQLVTT